MLEVEEAQLCGRSWVLEKSRKSHHPAFQAANVFFLLPAFTCKHLSDRVHVCCTPVYDPRRAKAAEDNEGERFSFSLGTTTTTTTRKRSCIEGCVDGRKVGLAYVAPASPCPSVGLLPKAHDGLTSLFKSHSRLFDWKKSDFLSSRKTAKKKEQTGNADIAQCYL